MKFVTRAGWGAKPPTCVNGFTQPVDTLVFHYSAADADEQADHKNCAARVKGIQAFHMGPSRGWCDIAYNWLVCKHGYVFEGRGWTQKSAATGKDNSHTIACCFLGDDSKGRDDVTPAGRKAMVEVGKAFLKVYKSGKFFRGHRDFMQTQCPGDEIYGFIRSKGYEELVRGEIHRVIWPVPTPQWFIDWMVWVGGGRKGPRPAKIPAKIPQWAWILRKRIVG